MEKEQINFANRGWTSDPTRPSQKRYTRLRYILTSHNRKLGFTGSCRPPKKGEIYLKPSGIRDIYDVMVANCDHKNHNYTICFIISR